MERVGCGPILPGERRPQGLRDEQHAGDNAGRMGPPARAPPAPGGPLRTRRSKSRGGGAATAAVSVLPSRAAMPARDSIHDNVRRALERDGWTITHDPL